MATNIKLVQLGFISALFFVLGFSPTSQIQGQSAIGQCTGVVNENNFTILVDGSGAIGSYGSR
ncbi:MAG: hypothetical protein ACJA01_001887 [Saprospiraceae bacterium]|jgi:hypothetical protein